MRQHLGGLGRKPQRVQGRALPLAAQARGAGEEPRRPPRRRGVQGQSPAARRAGAEPSVFFGKSLNSY
ncbi:hypothetical protein D7X33_00960 [Butyricicoccus sp. 1XD8-22]|nr:hypothetical protein D7X33_00960 [Butyricicoccus sp. 1XD8-22]